MLIDTEKNQKFLSLLYSLQNNYSNAVSTPNYLASLILNKKVYLNISNDKYFFGLEPVNTKDVKKQKKVGRPKIVLNDEILYLKFECEKSNREIAKILKVSEGTIRNYLKELIRN